MLDRLSTKIPSSSRQRGAGLIEVLIAVVITALILTAVAISLSYSVRNTAEARYRELATDRAQEVIEYVRKYRVIDGWVGFKAQLDRSPHTFCLNENIEEYEVDYDVTSEWLPEPTADCPVAPDTDARTSLARVLSVENVSDDILTVNVEVSWLSSNGETRELSFQQQFANY